MNARAFGIIMASLCMAATGLPAFGQGSAPRAELDRKPIGQVQNVTGSATIEHPSGILLQASVTTGGLEQTKVNDPIYLGDVIQTGADGSIGIIFGDGTSFVTSANARMEINEFIYDPKGRSNSTLFNLTKGTWTFLAGKTAKTGNMRVETPVGTMGIRGTAPHVEIVDSGTVKFTTLIEASKNLESASEAVPEPVQRQRRAEAPLSESDRRKGERNWLRVLTICRSC